MFFELNKYKITVKVKKNLLFILKKITIKNSFKKTIK